MRAWVIILLLIAIGVVGAWIGYWVGHALGWSEDAVWPTRIGGGDLAILLSILVSFASVMAGIGWFVARPLYRTRRLLATGRPGHATVRRVWRTGLFMNTGAAETHQLAFELEMHPDDGGDFEAKAFGILSQADEDALKPGAEVMVRYDPQHPARIAVVGPAAASAS